MKNKLIQIKRKKRIARHKRLRKKIQGVLKRPRLSIFRSSKHIYAQIINDEIGHTMISASDRDLKAAKKTKHDKAYDVGKLLAKKAKEAKITKIVFDRGGFKFHGRIKSLVDGAREGGLVF